MQEDKNSVSLFDHNKVTLFLLNFFFSQMEAWATSCQRQVFKHLELAWKIFYYLFVVDYEHDILMLKLLNEN